MAVPYRIGIHASSRLYVRGKQHLNVHQAIPLAGEKYALKHKWQVNFWVPYLQVAGKVAGWPIVIGQPRLIGLLNWHSWEVGRGPLFLLYDQPVALDVIKNHLEVRDETNQSLEIQVYRPRNSNQVTRGKIDPRWLAAVKIKELPGESKTIKMGIPPGFICLAPNTIESISCNRSGSTSE